MTSVPQREFQSVTPVEPPKLVRLSDLTRALVTHKLHDQIWPEGPSRRARTPVTRGYVSVRSRRHPIVRNAQSWGEAEIREDLRSGLLTAYVPAEERGAFWMIPSDFWGGKFAGLSAGGTLYDVPYCTAVPVELAGSTIFIFEENAYNWFLERKINEDNPDYPRNVRKCRPLKIWKIPPHPVIQAKMMSLMEDEGYLKNDAGKRIGLLRGFKGVGNAMARASVEDCNLKPGRRPNKKR